METKSSLNIYKASAGSGKTFTLTVEYIYLMIRPQAEEEYAGRDVYQQGYSRDEGPHTAAPVWHQQGVGQ